MLRHVPVAFAAFSLAMSASAHAQGVVSHHDIALQAANQIASQAVAACAAKGYNVAATVVDRAGNVRALQRADNAGPHTLEASRLKAYTSASAKNTTLAIMEASQKNPGAANLGAIPGYLLLGGGVPVKVGDEVIGAVGVGGAPAGNIDQDCAQAGIASVQELLK